jgi:hypothetical protein
MTPNAYRLLVLPLLVAASPALGQAPKLMSAEAMAIACGPAAVYEMPEMKLTVAGSLTDAKGVFAPWHRLTVNGGSDQGLKPGQEYFVRRPIPDKDAAPRGERAAIAIATIGWIRLDTVHSEQSIATVIHECDGIEPGDYLEPFAVPTVPEELPGGSPDYTATGTVLFGSERRQMEGAGSLMIVDLGSEKGIKPGQRFTIFRASEAGPNVIVASATALRVSPETTMVRISEMRDVVQVGDRVAPHK